jgi:hypothetical protein
LTDYVFLNNLFHAPDPSLVDFAFTYRTEIRDYLAQRNLRQELIEYCIDATKRYTYQRNQYINYTKSYDRLVYSEYEDLLKQFQSHLRKVESAQRLSRFLTDLLAQHHERLRLILASYCVSYYSHSLEENPMLRSVPCEEYSSAFQLSVLNMTSAERREPILDIGCGAEGSLVNCLRGQGHEAFGLDRLAPPGDEFFRQDWFEFDYGRQAWGTILAHHSLSTHFIYHHLHNAGQASQYAQLFMRILSSLQSYGTFCYAPGLPFFEDHIIRTAEYSVCRTTLSNDDLPGIGELAYSTKISRLS